MVQLSIINPHTIFSLFARLKKEYRKWLFETIFCGRNRNRTNQATDMGTTYQGVVS